MQGLRNSQADEKWAGVIYINHQFTTEHPSLSALYAREHIDLQLHITSYYATKFPALKVLPLPGSQWLSSVSLGNIRL